MSTIKMHYEEVIAEANRIAGLADAGEQHLREMKNIQSQIPGYWMGAAADAMVNACEVWARDMSGLVNSLQTVSREIKMVAEEVRAAEIRSTQAVQGSDFLRLA